MKIAILGATPEGIRTAEFFAALPDTQVDIFDARPAPLGLTQYGTSHPALRFIGNVVIGRDLSREELDPLYDAVISTNSALTTSDTDILDLIRQKGIPHTTWSQQASNYSPSPRDWLATFRAAQGVPVCI